jgi:hypothetical protein
MSVTKSQYADWKNHPVTQELKEDIQGNMENYVAELVRDNLDRNYDRDHYLRAYVALATDVLGYTPELREDDQDA